MDFEFLPNGPREVLETEFRLRKLRRPAYSLRAFARDLELSPSSLSEFLKGEYGFSFERVQLLSKKLHFSDEQRSHFWDLMEAHYARDKTLKKKAALRIQARKNSKQTTLSSDQFKLISEWFHLAIKEYVSIFPHHSLKQISTALKISDLQAEEGMNRLLRIGLLKQTDQGFAVNENFTSIGNHVPSRAIKDFHLQVLEKAQQAVEQQSLEMRELRSTFFSIKKSDLVGFRQELTKAYMEVVQKYSSREEPDSLYCASLQIFNLCDESVIKKDPDNV